MNAKETLELISKQWCNLDDLMKLSNLGINNAFKLKKEIKHFVKKKATYFQKVYYLCVKW